MKALSYAGVWRRSIVSSVGAQMRRRC